MWGLRRDQVEVHEENNCLLHENVYSVGNKVSWVPYILLMTLSKTLYFECLIL
jgi:hypothetical protein